MLVWVELAACIGIYVFLTHLSMLSAFEMFQIHDIVSLSTDNIYIWHAAIWFPLGPLVWRVCKGVTVKWVGQLSRLILLKAILQFVTVTPAPNGMRDCDPYAVFWIFSCANMMFSGQVALTLLALQGFKSRWMFALFQSILVVVAGVHYMSDCIVAVLAVLYMETLDINIGDLVPNGIPATTYSCAYFARTCKKKAHRMSTKTRVYERVNGEEQHPGGERPSADADVPTEFGLATP